MSVANILVLLSPGNKSIVRGKINNIVLTSNVTNLTNL